MVYTFNVAEVRDGDELPDDCVKTKIIGTEMTAIGTYKVYYLTD